MFNFLNLNLIFSVFITFIGLSYWKVTSRKVFWVNAGDIENFQQVLPSFEIEVVDTSDVVPPRRKRSASPCPVSSEILSEIKNVKEQ